MIENKKNIWIFNHYIIPPFVESGHRHCNFAKYLSRKGYNVSLFFSSKLHNIDNNLIKDNCKYRIIYSEKARYIAIRTRSYKDNGRQRFLNIFDYFIGLLKTTNNISKLYGIPDIIYSSSVHPLTCVAGILIAKRYKAKSIVEIRDLWPESLVAYGLINRYNPILKLFYLGEKWIYRKADKLIFTIEGGIDYIKEKKWETNIDISKIHNINNGVDLEEFNYNKENISMDDIDLNNKRIFKVVYTGSIRKTNNIQILVNTAKKLQDNGYDKVKFIVYGDGDYRECLKKYAKDNGINNIIFKGRVNKQYIPFILSKCDLNILDLYHDELFRFGVSPNKLFDYFASGKPILSIECGYDLIKKYQCGVTMKVCSADEITKQIILYYNMGENQIKLLSQNALKAARDYDYKLLTDKLIELF